MEQRDYTRYRDSRDEFASSNSVPRHATKKEMPPLACACAVIVTKKQVSFFTFSCSGELMAAPVVPVLPVSYALVASIYLYTQLSGHSSQ